jgi:peptidylprolyl isomerase
MKLPPIFRYRRLIFAGMLFVALVFGAMSPIFSSSAQAQTNAPASANGPAAASAPAPAGSNVEKDKDTGKPIVTTPSGLKYVDLVVGKGPDVKTGDHILVNYEGKLIDGTKFDSSYDRGQPFDLRLGVSEVIKGWTEGLAGMKAGGTRKLIIPPQLGYGNQGYPDVIPPNATLIFKVEVVSIVAEPAKGN